MKTANNQPTVKYGQELIESLMRKREVIEARIANRRDRIDTWQTDEEDCFISMKVDADALSQIDMKLYLLRNGGTSKFREYATLDGKIVNARWCNTKYGWKLRVVMPNGEVIWTSSDTKNGLAKRGLKQVICTRPAWIRFTTNDTGLNGVMSGYYTEFPSRFNYATGDVASDDPIEMVDYDYAEQ